MRTVCVLISALAVVALAVLTAFFPPAASPAYSSHSTAGPFVLIALPDTQIYSESYPEIFTTQTQWIRDHKYEDNIVFTVHLGDIVNRSDDKQQWWNADTSMSNLDGVVPYSLAVGNHDLATNGATDDRGESVKSFNAYFPASRYESETWYGGRMGEGNENSFSFFHAGGIEFMVISLEFGPRDETLEWANKIVSKYNDKRVIVATHSYMYGDNTRVGNRDGWDPHRFRISYDDNNGEEMWDKFVKLHPNIFLVLSGHALNGGVGRLTSAGVHGNAVHQMLANYQAEPYGGVGWLRTMRFVPDDDKIYVTTYSPYIDGYKTDPYNTFELDYDMSEAVNP